MFLSQWPPLVLICPRSVPFDVTVHFSLLVACTSEVWDGLLHQHFWALCVSKPHGCREHVQRVFFAVFNSLSMIQVNGYMLSQWKADLAVSGRWFNGQRHLLYMWGPEFQCPECESQMPRAPMGRQEAETRKLWSFHVHSRKQDNLSQIMWKVRMDHQGYPQTTRIPAFTLTNVRACIHCIVHKFILLSHIFSMVLCFSRF